MLIKTLLDLAAKDLGASGGTAYSSALKLQGVSDLSSLAVFLHASKKAGTDPTLDVNLQVSWDGTNWIDSGLAFTQVTTSANANEAKAWESNMVGPQVRVKYVIGGTDTPAYDILVIISAFGPGGSW